jgi:hypothetical protein
MDVYESGKLRDAPGRIRPAGSTSSPQAGSGQAAINGINFACGKYLEKSMQLQGKGFVVGHSPLAVSP